MVYIASLAALYTCKRQRFCVALSGGTLIDIMASALNQQCLMEGVDWSAWHVFWADERWVSWQSTESNYGEASRRFLNRLPIPEVQIHAMDMQHSPDKTAQQYSTILETILKPGQGHYPRFDLILLGVGPDGHTASLFPNHPVLNETREWVSPVTNAPKPPPNRVTLTLPVINCARNIVWVVSGSSKADIVARLLNPSPDSMTVPAARVIPYNGVSRWFLDQAAAASL